MFVTLNRDDALGSVTDRLVHSSPVTLALAPRG